MMKFLGVLVDLIYIWIMFAMSFFLGVSTFHANSSVTIERPLLAVLLLTVAFFAKPVKITIKRKNDENI